MKLVIIQRIFPLYRKPFFDLLSKKYKLLVLHSKINNNIKQTVEDYSRLIYSIKYYHKNTSYFLFTVLKILRLKPQIVVHEFTPSIISLPLTWLIAKLINSKFILWGHGYNRNVAFDPDNKLTDRIRIFMMKTADALILYDYSSRIKLSQFIDQKKIFVAPNTIDTGNLIRLKNEFSKMGKEKIKKNIGFSRLYNIVFLGRLIPNKYPEYVIKVLELLNKSLNNLITVHFVGDGPSLPSLIEYTKQKYLDDQVVFHGAIYDDLTTGKILFSSDLVLIPGHLGLAINHALSFDCPIFSFKTGSSGPYHAPESEYLTENKTGFWAKPFDINDMSLKIYNYLTNRNLQLRIKSEISEYVNSNISINRMIVGFEEALNFCNKN